MFHWISKILTHPHGIREQELDISIENKQCLKEAGCGLPVQAWRPESGTQDTAKSPCDPSSGEVKEDGSLRLAGQSTDSSVRLHRSSPRKTVL